MEIGVERRVYRVCRTDHKECVAIGGCLHNCLSADIVATAPAVLNDEWLAEPLRQPLPNQARKDIARAPGRIRHDQTHGPRRVGLRRSEAHGRKRGSACRQTKKSSTGKFHSGSSLTVA